MASSAFARRAKEAKELASSKLSKVQATMRSDYVHLAQGLKAGGVKGGLDAAKNIKNRIMVKETKTTETKQPEKKVYGGGIPIPMDPSTLAKQ